MALTAGPGVTARLAHRSTVRTGLSNEGPDPGRYDWSGPASSSQYGDWARQPHLNAAGGPKPGHGGQRVNVMAEIFYEPYYVWLITSKNQTCRGLSAVYMLNKVHSTLRQTLY